jgi:hypothetical protein
MSHEPDWYAELADALKSRKLDPTRIDEIVAEARAHCEASGEEPLDAFGDAHTYATHVTSAEDPDETRFQRTAERNEDLRMPFGYRLVAWLGVSLAGIAGMGWLIGGTWRTLTGVELFTWLIMLVVLAGVQLREEARRAGHPSTARRYFVAWVALLSLLAVVGELLPLPETALVRLPLPPLVLVGVAAAVAGWWLGGRWTKAHPPVPHLPAEAWLDRLAGLLEGRYRLTAARAREFRAEAAAHLAESGGDPEQEFGPVDDYAAELAERSGLDRRRRGWPTWVTLTLGLLIYGSVAAYVVSQAGFLNIRSGILLVVTFLFAKAVVGKAVRGYRTSSARRSTWAGSPDQQ